MAKKREINKDDYPMVTDWSGYKNTHTLLPTICDVCNCIVYKSIKDLDRQKTYTCYECGKKNSGLKNRRIVNREDYPMVTDWSIYEDTRTKLPCKCDGCGCIVPKSINLLNIADPGGASCGSKEGNALRLTIISQNLAKFLIFSISVFGRKLVSITS